MFTLKNNGLLSNRANAVKTLISFFKTLKDTEGSPLRVALESLEELETTAQTEDEFILYCLEDIVFSSLYATYYEELLMSLRDNQTLCQELIAEFNQSTPKREELISQQAQEHVRYVENYGNCDGCNSCSNHQDVNELIGPWQTRDMDFFVKMYLGMQAIQCTFEQLIYDELPQNPRMISGLNPQGILEFREFIYNYCSNYLKKARF